VDWRDITFGMNEENEEKIFEKKKKTHTSGIVLPDSIRLLLFVYLTKKKEKYHIF